MKCRLDFFRSFLKTGAFNGLKEPTRRYVSQWKKKAVSYTCGDKCKVFVVNHVGVVDQLQFIAFYLQFGTRITKYCDS